MWTGHDATYKEVKNGEGRQYLKKQIFLSSSLERMIFHSFIHSKLCHVSVQFIPNLNQPYLIHLYFLTFSSQVLRVTVEVSSAWAKKSGLSTERHWFRFYQSLSAKPVAFRWQAWFLFPHWTLLNRHPWQ